MQRYKNYKIKDSTPVYDSYVFLIIFLLPSWFEDRYFDHLSNDWYQRNQRNPQVHLHVNNNLKQLNFKFGDGDGRNLCRVKKVDVSSTFIELLKIYFGLG